jgi:hypothetical protein
MAGPWGVLPAGLTAATTGVGYVDGGPPRGCFRHVRQRPPPELETSMVGPLGGASGRSGSGHHRSWRRQWWAPLDPWLSSAKKVVGSKMTSGGVGPELPLLSVDIRSHSSLQALGNSVQQ